MKRETAKAQPARRPIARGGSARSAGRPSRGAALDPDVTDDAVFESSLLDYQDEHEALDLIDGEPSSQPGEVLPPEVPSVEFPDDGEKRRELHRLQKLRAHQDKPLRGKPRAANGEQPAVKQRGDSAQKLDHQADETSKASFPASDPPATTASGVGGKR